MRGLGNIFKSWGVLVVNAREEKFKFVRGIGWMLRGRSTSSITCMNIKCNNKYGATTSEHHYSIKFWQ